MSAKRSIKINYRITVEKSLIIALCLIICLLILFPTYRYQLTEKKAMQINIAVEDIPITKQGLYRPPPPKPAVPIPTEDESIPEDETIETTDLDLELRSIASSGFNQGFGTSSYIPPRPIAEVIPEYPKQDYKKGVTGVIKLHINIDSTGKVIDVVVLENTTNSKRCAAAATIAAYKCRYIPARQGNKPIDSWTTRLITFDIPK